MRLVCETAPPPFIYRSMRLTRRNLWSGTKPLHVANCARPVYARRHRSRLPKTSLQEFDVDIKQLSEDQFLCEGHITRVPEAMSDFDSLAAMLMGQDLTANTLLRDLGSWKIVRFGQSDALLLDDRGNLQGLYIGDALMLGKPALGRGLSVPLILAAVELRPPPTERILTRAGEAALRKAWRVANGKEDSPWTSPPVEQSQSCERNFLGLWRCLMRRATGGYSSNSQP